MTRTVNTLAQVEDFIDFGTSGIIQFKDITLTVTEDLKYYVSKNNECVVSGGSYRVWTWLENNC